MPDLALWISPYNGYQTPAQVAAAASGVHLPGHRTIVLLPTLYDDWPQQALSKRAIGDALAVDSPADCASVRQAIEACGVACGGWSVPRGTGDAYAEGYAHGQAAAQFEVFILNYEQWTARENDPSEEYWVHPQDSSYVNAFMDGFEQALAEAGAAPIIGLTYVTNSMFTNAGDDVERAWLRRVNFVALEAYYPGDRNLDPAKSLELWAKHCTDDLRIAAVPACAIVAQGDIVTDAQTVSDPAWGVEVWTLEEAARAEWPAADEPPTEAPVPEPEAPAEPEPIDIPWQQKRGLVINTLGLIHGDELAAVLAARTKKDREAQVARIRALIDQALAA